MHLSFNYHKVSIKLENSQTTMMVLNMIGVIKIALISSRYIKMQTLVKMLKTQKSLEDRVTANIQFGQIILSNTQ